MSEYNKFLENVYSDELSFIDPDEVNHLMNHHQWEGYQEFSEEIEQSAWKDSKEFSGILIKKQCEHTRCNHFQCERSTRLGGIEI